MSEQVSVPTGRRGAWHWLCYVGLFFLGLAIAALVYELWLGSQSGGYRTIAAGELWFKIHGPSLNVAQAVIQRYLHPALWDPGIITLLKWPAWSLFGAIGAVLTILFGPWLRARR
ncbi:MAG: hypothetical protein ACR2QF_11235 [Geminicoccaceae bacterium]